MWKRLPRPDSPCSERLDRARYSLPSPATPWGRCLSSVVVSEQVFAMKPGDHTEEVLTLVADEPAEDDDMAALMGRLQRLCRAARRDLAASGVGVSIISEAGGLLTAAASSPDSAQVEELQFTMGEGPCLAAFASRRPLLIPNLGEAATTTWPGYGPAAHNHGVRAVFAFPLQIGAVRLGALDVYRDEPGELSTWALSRARTYADVAMQTVLDAQETVGESGDSLWSDGDDAHFEVYQAQGMVMIQLGVGAAEALSRMRAYAYANNSRLGQVTEDIIGRRLTLEPDHPGH